MSIGDTVLDGFKQTVSWLDNGTEWLADLADFYRERSHIEREAAQKLAALTTKHFSKKANASAAVSVGDKPLTTPGSLENMSMQAYTQILMNTEQMSTERRMLADELSKHVADELQSLKMKFEELVRKFRRSNEALEEHSEKVASHVKRAKSQYDAACTDMESARAKNKKNIEPREHEMQRLKNQYLVEINVANRMKDKQYHDDLPELLDLMQRAYEARVSQTNRLLKLASNFEKRRLDHQNECLATCVAAIDGNHVELDTQMFIEHNANAFQWADPPDFLFEPSPIWHDNDQMVTSSEDALRHLTALLGDASAQTTKCGADSQQALAKYDKAREALKEVNFGELTPAQTAPVLTQACSALSKLVEAENQRLAAEVEVEAIEAATAAVDMSHVPQTRIKTHRTLFGKKKEVVEVVADGGKSRHGKHKLGLQSLLARARIGSDNGEGGPQASIKYDFQAAQPNELSVQAGAVLELVENDDGSGWVRVRGNIGEGLVPASYVDVLFGGMVAGNQTETGYIEPSPQSLPPASPAKPPPPPARGSQDPKMVAIYAYDATDSSQLSIAVNDVITVIEPDSGGWTTGVLHGRQGIFPTAYAQPM